MDHFIAFLGDYGLLGVFLSMAVESVGVPFPTEGGYIVAQALITKGMYPAWMVYATLYAGHMAGALASYFAGRRISSDFLKKRREYTDTQKRVAGWYKKYGVATVFGARLVGYVRPWSSYVAGIAEVPFWQFFILTSLGTIILNAVCMAFTGTFVHIWEHYPALRFVLICSMAAGFVFIAVRSVGNRRHA